MLWIILTICILISWVSLWNDSLLFKIFYPQKCMLALTNLFTELSVGVKQVFPTHLGAFPSLRYFVTYFLYHVLLVLYCF